MKNKDIKIVTSTKYDLSKPVDQVRVNIAAEMVKEATRRGYEVIVVDGSEGYYNRNISLKLEHNGAKLYIQKEKTIGSARRQAIKEALKRDPKVIIWTEPEKKDLVRFVEQLTNPLISGDFELVIPKRKSLISYPFFQQLTEKEGNDYFRKLTGVDVDIYFGPKAWIPKHSRFFLDYNTCYGDNQEAIMIPPLEIILAGIKYYSLEIEFKYDPRQRQVEENNKQMNIKRLTQLREISRSFRKFSQK